MTTTLFSIYHPYTTNWLYTIGELMFGLHLYPKTPINNNSVYPVYIENNILHTHRPCRISKFLKNNISYAIYSDEYRNGKDAIVKALIYDDSIEILLGDLHHATFSGDKMSNILLHLQTAYEQHKCNLNDFS